MVIAEAAASSPAPHVLIVDEINRGDLSKILGELIFALEYRGQPVTTPYSVSGSSTLMIPKNLYLIGTMNSADRSIALIDYAIRRRFSFVDVPSSRTVLETILEESLKFGALERILALYDATNEPLLTNSDLMVGHSYFLGSDVRQIAERYVFQVLPLLAEYKREGILGDTVVIHPTEWASKHGIRVDHPAPFELVQDLIEWISN